MIELKYLSEPELAARMVNYIERLKTLMGEVSNILNNRRRIEPYVQEQIRNSYKELKEEIKADAHYVSLVRNERHGNNLYCAFFVPSVQEAAAFGFTVPTNGSINHGFYSAIEEAHYKLTKYYDLDEWREIAQQ